MTRPKTDRLPAFWEADVLEDQWPDALIAAVHLDVGALATPRVTATLRAWRAALVGPDAREREAARARLAALGAALLAEPSPRPQATERMDTVALLPERPPMPRANPEHITDAAVPVVVAAVPAFPDQTPDPRAPELTQWAYGQPGWAPDDSGDEDAIDPLLADMAGHRARPALTLDVDDDDTAHADPLGESATQSPIRSRSDRRGLSAPTIGLPLAPALAALAPPLRGPSHAPPPLDEFSDEPPTTASHVHESLRRAPSMPAAVPQRAPPPPPPPVSVVGPPPSAPPPAPSASAAPSSPPPTASADRRSVPPRAGVVRRATVPPQPAEPPRPRASLVQVRALYAAIQPLCRELVPLNHERRSRRFWTHWREVSGDRGVRREVAEQILETARDTKSLAAGLIAEVQSVDLESVRALLDRLDEAELTEGAPGRTGDTPSPRVTEDRARGPLVGAVVRVEALPNEPKE